MYLVTYDGDNRKQKYTKRIVLQTDAEVLAWIEEQCVKHGLVSLWPQDDPANLFFKLRVPDDEAISLSWRWDRSIYYRSVEFTPGVGF